MTLAELNKVTDYTNFDKIKVDYKTEEEYINPYDYMEVTEEELTRVEDYWNVNFITFNKIWKTEGPIIVMYINLEKIKSH